MATSYNGLTKPSRRMNRDWLMMAPRGDCARVAHAALSGIQNEVPELMLAGAAVLFATMVQRCGLDPQEMHHMGLKILKARQVGMRRDNDSLQSLQDFAGIRVMGEKEVVIA